MHLREAGDVAPGPGQTLDISCSHGIAMTEKNNRDAASCLFDGVRLRSGVSDDQVHSEGHEFCRQRREAVKVTLRGTVLDCDVATLDPTQVSERLLEDACARRYRRSIQKANPVDSRCLLRRNGEGRGEQANDNSGGERATADHSMT